MTQTSILIVMGEVEVGKYYKKILDLNGYNAKFVSDGKNALEIAKSELPDIILLGLKFIDIDGIEVCRELKNNDETKEIKVIINTIKSEPETIEIGFGAGADLYLTKPHGMPVIIKVLEDALTNPKFPGEEIQKIDVVYAPKSGI